MDILAIGGLIAERLPLPDTLVAAGMRLAIGERDRLLRQADLDADAQFATQMQGRPVAEYADAANAQHYELPPEFFGLILGPRRKYSSCFYQEDSSLGEAEELALCETAAHAELANGQDVLELGCGWGSLSLWMAAKYPQSHITALSNSSSQRRYIEDRAKTLGLNNLDVVTSDISSFSTDKLFDRIVSVEMFEHMANWGLLLSRLHTWLAPSGKLFVHVFSHQSGAYRFDPADRNDWIARHFFAGGIMPSHTLLGQFRDSFEIESFWRWNGLHYMRTARDWLTNYDRNEVEISKILRDVYGKHHKLWQRRWRMFFLATSELFGHAAGASWGVSQYLLVPRSRSEQCRKTLSLHPAAHDRD